MPNLIKIVSLKMQPIYKECILLLSEEEVSLKKKIVSLRSSRKIEKCINSNNIKLLWGKLEALWELSTGLSQQWLLVEENCMSSLPLGVQIFKTTT